MCSQVSTYLNFKYIIVMNGTTKFISQMCHEESPMKNPKENPYFINFSVVPND
jgi:hypothetical protein